MLPSYILVVVDQRISSRVKDRPGPKWFMRQGLQLSWYLLPLPHWEMRLHIVKSGIVKEIFKYIPTSFFVVCFQKLLDFRFSIRGISITNPFLFWDHPTESLSPHASALHDWAFHSPTSDFFAPHVITYFQPKKSPRVTSTQDNKEILFLSAFSQQILPCFEPFRWLHSSFPRNRIAPPTTILS